MSLQVMEHESARAEAGELTDKDFRLIVERSLPTFVARVQRIANRLNSGESFVIVDDPCTDAERGQILRGMASSSIRGLYERALGIDLAFRNCHAMAARLADTPNRKFDEFVSVRSQVLAQQPELLDC